MIPINLDITTVSLYLLMCLAGDFKRVILTFIIIILHETGHIIFLKYFQIPITKLTIYPFGGLIKTNKLINFTSKNDVKEGDFVNVKITSAKTWSLDGEVVE